MGFSKYAALILASSGCVWGLDFPVFHDTLLCSESWLYCQ
jgi:hypothetical protein